MFSESTSFMTKKRPKHGSKSPKPDIKSPSSSSLRGTVMEPPESLFPSKEELLRLIAILAIASSVALTCNFFVSYINPTIKPFCDSNIDSPDSFSDFCEPCPINGECTEGNLECSQGYRKHRNMCIEDGDINERAKKLVCSKNLVHYERVETRLCEAYAQFLCEGAGTIWVQEDDIWNGLDENQLMENLQQDNGIYAFTKKKTMEIISSLLETRTNSYGKKELKCPDLVVEHYKPITCRSRQWISNHAFVLVPLCALVVVSTVLLGKIQRRWYLSTRSEELYKQVCEILEDNALMSKKSNAECEPWLVASQLRDHLLLPKERKDSLLWKRVEELVQEDSRIDQYPKLVKGDSKVVWEWQVESSWCSMKKKERREISKSKSVEKGIEENSDRQIPLLKSDTKKTWRLAF